MASDTVFETDEGYRQIILVPSSELDHPEVMLCMRKYLLTQVQQAHERPIRTYGLGLDLEGKTMRI